MAAEVVNANRTSDGSARRANYERGGQVKAQMDNGNGNAGGQYDDE